MQHLRSPRRVERRPSFSRHCSLALCAQTYQPSCRCYRHRSVRASWRCVCRAAGAWACRIDPVPAADRWTCSRRSHAVTARTCPSDTRTKLAFTLLTALIYDTFNQQICSRFHLRDFGAYMRMESSRRWSMHRSHARRRRVGSVVISVTVVIVIHTMTPELRLTWISVLCKNQYEKHDHLT